MSERKKVNLALQGGGSHGAFTWGVLDYLLEDGRLDIAAVSGTSAGAMNAVVLAEGWLENGREGARENSSSSGTRSRRKMHYRRRKQDFSICFSGRRR